MPQELRLSLTCLRVKPLFLFLMLSGSACLGQTWTLPLFSSDPHAVLTAAARYSAPEDRAALILDYSISAQIDESGKLQKTTRIVTKVLRVQGIDQVQHVSLAWSLARENKPVVKARVITSDGQQHLLDDGRTAERDPSGPGAAGAVKLLFVSLPDVDIDSVVELQILEGDREPAFPGGRLAALTIPPELLIVHFKASITSLSPADLRVETRSFPGAKVTTEPGLKGHAASVEVYNFENHRIADFLPPDFAPLPTIVFTNVSSWQSVAQWYSRIVDKAKSSPGSSHETFGGDEPSAVEKIYEDMRSHIQDNGLELAAGSVAPRSTAEILKSGFADSKDEALLLINKLAEAGISAKVALISAAPQPDALPSQPGFEAFNRALVYVNGKTPLWIDPTAEYTPVTRLPAADQGRWALLIDGASDQLIRTPALTAADNRENGQTEIRLGDGTPPKVHQTIEAFGSFEDTLRRAIGEVAAADEEQRKRIVSPLFHGVGGAQVESTTFSDPNRLMEKCRLQIDGEGYVPSMVSDDGGYVDLPGPARLNFLHVTPLLNAQNRDQSSASPRIIDFYVAPPFVTESGYHVIPPAGYRLKEVSPLPELKVGPMSIVTTTKLDKDGTCWLTYTLALPQSRLAPKDVDAMRADARKIAARNFFRVELENVGLAKMKSGDLRDGMKILRDDSDAAKDNVNPALRLASGYVLVGARFAAIKRCEDLLKRDGSKAQASSRAASNENAAAIYERLGWVYEHDEFGRLLAPGMNMTEAEKNLHKATELAPSDANAWLRLAELYTYNSAAVRFGRSARLNDAVDIFSRLDLDVTTRNGKLNDYALLLLHAHKYSELRELFIYPQADLADQAIKWAGIAAARSESDFKDELEFRYPSLNDRRILLVEVGRRLIAIREYQVAARVLGLAGKGSDITQSQLDRVRVFDDSTLSKQPALAAFQRYVQSLLDPADLDDWQKLVTSELGRSTLEAQRNALLQFFHSLTASVDNPSVWPYLSDLITTALVYTVEGNDAVGFRLKASSGKSDSPSGVVAYVVKQGNQYLVAGLTNSSAPSIQAVVNARAGNMVAARQWLDWARETANLPKLPSADVQQALDLMSAQLLWSDGKPQEAATILLRLHQQNPSAKATTALLADSLIQSNHLADAKPYIESLEQSDPGAPAVLRLREHLSAQEGNYSEAAKIAQQICAHPNASASDWNDLAWATLFTRQNAPDAMAAAEKAAQLTNFSSPAILHTLAIAQASSSHVKDALATAYKFAAISYDSGEMHTIFGTIAYQVGLLDVASQYLAAVPKDSLSRLSNYSFAQLSLESSK